MKDIFTKAATILTLTTFIAMSCDKPFQIEQPLGVTTKVVNLQAKSGITPVVVYAAEGWTAQLTDNVEWASIDRLEGYGLSEIKFAYSQNFGTARQVGIVFNSSKETPDTVMMVQESGNPSPIFQFTKGDISVPKENAVINLEFVTDLIYNIDEIIFDIKYDQNDTVDWLNNIRISADGVSCEVAENNSSIDRSAVLTLSLPEVTGKVHTTFMKIKQLTTSL